ncbi:hypothetical protein HJ075_20550 [Vibrio parahaemolyticus]|nr:hypothetical protein [Vibrio parahaemolyticus]
MANTIINNKFEPSKRVFLTYCSFSVLTVAASTVFVPNKALVAVNNISLPSKKTKEANALALAGYPTQTFEQALMKYNTKQM